MKGHRFVNGKKSGDRRRFDRRTEALLAVAAVCCLVLVWLFTRPTSPSNESVSTAPGFRGSERSIDTTPFQLAEGEGSGATTIPPDQLNRPFASSTVPTTAPQPTTTLRASVGVDPNDKACLGVKTIVEGIDGKASMTGSPTVIGQAFKTVLLEGAGVLRQDPQKRWDAAAGELEVVAFQLNDAKTADQVQAALAPLVTDMTKLQSSTTATATVIDHVRQACPSFLP